MYFCHYRILTTDTPWLVCKGDTWGDLCEFKFWLMYYITTGSSQQTSHGSSVRVIHGVTSVSSNSDWCITSLQGPHNRHPMARLLGWYMGWPLWVQILIDVLHHYRVLTTDIPWLVCKGDTWGDLCEFKFWLMYYITTGSSQQTSHGSSVRVIHGVTSVSSNSDWCITSLQGPQNRHPMARPKGQHMGRLLQVQILIDALYHYRILTADTPWIVREDNIWGVLCEFKFWLRYQITTGPSQQTHHGLPAKVIQC